MNETKEIEVWEFERKSFIHWRAPFLENDPPRFVSRHKRLNEQGFNHLIEYQLNESYAFDIDDDWTIVKPWIYSDHFQSIHWSKNAFSSSHLCRKRCWKRIAKQRQYKQSISNSINESVIHPQQEHLHHHNGEHNHNINAMYHQCIVHEIEIYESSKWKPYENGWFDEDLNPIQTIRTPFDIKLTSLNTNPIARKATVWKWSEHWSCLDTKPMEHSQYNATGETIYLQYIMECEDDDLSKDIQTEEKEMEQHNKPTKKKKKRIRIKKNAKKWLKKMKGNKETKPKTEDRIDANTSHATNALPHDHHAHASDLLSAKEQNELFELFGSIDDRGWSYAVNLSTNDNDWNPEHNIITQCHFRRRTWVRGAICDDLMSSCVDAYDDLPPPRVPILSKSESLSQSILRSKAKANDLLALIDEYLTSGKMPQEERDSEDQTIATDDKESVGNYIMREILNGLLWHCHLCSISNVVGRLPNDDGIGTRISDETKIGKLYFMEPIEWRQSKINDFMISLQRLHFQSDDDDEMDWQSDEEGISAMCKKVYSDLCDLLYECAFHDTKQIYCDAQRISLLNRINEVSALYSMVNTSGCLSAVTELVLIMSCVVGLMEKANSEGGEDVNPLWIFDDLWNIRQQYNHATKFELSCLFLPDLLTNLKQFVYILSTLQVDKISKLERTICCNTTKRMLAILETYFPRLHHHVRPHTVVQLVQIFIALTDVYEAWIGKCPATTFKDIRFFLLEYHKLSMQNALDRITNDNDMLSMFMVCEAETVKDDSSEELYATTTTQKEHEMDTKHISCKLATEYSEERDPQDKRAMRERQKRLAKHFSKDEVQNMWWEFIDEIVNLMETDYEISIALWKGKIFNRIPCVGMERLAIVCGKQFAQSFGINPHGLDIAHRLLLCGAHKIEHKLQVMGHKIRTMDAAHEYKSMDDYVQRFSFVQYQIFERLSYWMDLSMNRVAIWIKRAAEKETWWSKDNKWGTFVTDSFSFINNELDAFFDHLMRFPYEGMSMAKVFFERLQVLVDTIVHLMERSMRDCTVLDNMDTNNQRKSTKCNIRDEVHKLDIGMQKNGVLKKWKRKQLMDSFLKEYVEGMYESSVKGKDIAHKFNETVSIASKNHELDGLKSMAQYVEHGTKSSLWNALPDLQRIEDLQFARELQFMCVKFSSLSRSMQIMDGLGGYLLNRIQTIPCPPQDILCKKFELHKQELVQSAYAFITNCKQEIKQCIQRSVHRMVYQLLSVQNGAYFQLKLYLHHRISSTTAIQIGLFQRIADYMNACSDHLSEADLQIIVREIAIRFARHMQEVLIGYSMKPPRVFEFEHDTPFIVQDFEECRKLFSDFGLNDKDGSLHVYYECVDYMKMETLRLMQNHMLLMAKRNEERKERYSHVHAYVDPIKAKAIADKAVIRKIYDSSILHVLTHRAEDEAALCYVENFVQYRHRNKPLMIDLSEVEDMLRIIVHEGKGLPAIDCSLDPYCVVRVMPFKLKNETRVVRQTLNPKWDQAVDFKISKLVSQHIIIEFDVWDWNSNHHIGKYTERIEFGQRNIHEKWIFLYNNENNKVNGQLCISLQCQNLWK
eukprot:1028553_1